MSAHEETVMTRRMLRTLHIWILTICLLSAADPSLPGPFSVVHDGYDYGDSAWSHPDLPGDVEFTAAITRPAELQAGPFPLLLILHGRHASTYDPVAGTSGQWWPPAEGEISLPNHRGYAWLADLLASHGCFVVSVRHNGMVLHDSSQADGGSHDRAHLLRAHYDYWRTLASSGAAPFGTRFQGRVDCTRIGVLGHSRGGAGIASFVDMLRMDGLDSAVRAVGLIAPTNWRRAKFHGMPLAFITGYLDGDVTDIGGMHYFDDFRHIDPSPRHLAVIMGGNHNFFNSYWDPSVFALGSWDDAPADVAYAIEGEQQRELAAAWLGAFYRQYLLADQRWLPQLIDPASLGATLPEGELHLGYQPPRSARLVVNGTRELDAITSNDLAGAVSDDGAMTASTIGGGEPEPDHLINPKKQGYAHSYQEVHWDDSPPGLRQVVLTWTDVDGVWRNDVPAAYQDCSALTHLQFRLGVVFVHAGNAVDQAQDLHVVIRDGNGQEQGLRLSDWSAAGGYPREAAGDQDWPKLMLYPVRMPLSAFDAVDLSDVQAIELHSDIIASGQIILSDLLLDRDDDSAPTATGISLTGLPASVGQELTASIDAVDPDGQALTLNWDWGDGSADSDDRHSYALPGRYVITVTADDGTLQARWQRSVEVTGSNQAPTCSQLADRSVDQGASVDPIAVTISDDHLPVDDLVISLASDNEELLPLERISLHGDGEERQLHLQPAPTISGSATVTLTVGDGLSSTSRSCVLTVAAQPAPHQAPLVIDGWGSSHTVYDYYVEQGTDWERTFFLQADDSIVDWSTIAVTAVSETPALLPQSAISLTLGSWKSVRDLTVQIPADASGIASISLTADDGVVTGPSTTVYLHFVPPGNQAPIIDVAATEAGIVAIPGLATVTVPAVVDDPDDGPAALHYDWRLSNYPEGFAHSSPTWTFRHDASTLANPLHISGLDMPGEYWLHLTVSDGMASSSETITLTIPDMFGQVLAAWDLDEASGRRLDRQAYRLDLEPIGSVASIHGRLDRGIGTSGSGALLHADAHPLPEHMQTGLSVSGLLELDGSVSGVVAALRDAAGRGWTLRCEQGALQWLVDDGAGAITLDSGSALSPGWHAVVAVYDGVAGRLALYLDGAQVAERTNGVPDSLDMSRAAFSLAGQVQQGAVVDGFSGCLDQVALFAGALDATTITALADHHSGNQAPGLRWLSPVAGIDYQSHDQVELAVAVHDPDDDNVTVDFYRMPDDDGRFPQLQHLATLTQEPYRWTWADAPLGTSRVIAHASDGQSHGPILEAEVYVSPITYLPSGGLSVQVQVKSHEELHVLWQSIPNASAYTVHWASDPLFSMDHGSHACPPGQTSLRIRDLQPERLYYVKVEAER